MDKLLRIAIKKVVKSLSEDKDSLSLLLTPIEVILLIENHYVYPRKNEDPYAVAKSRLKVGRCEPYTNNFYHPLDNFFYELYEERLHLLWKRKL